MDSSGLPAKILADFLSVFYLLTLELKEQRWWSIIDTACKCTYYNSN